jgi:hypothetical protein
MPFGQDYKPMKASDLEKEWGEDLIKRGVFDKPMNWKEEFDKTKFAKNGGSCFECCDYEEMKKDLQYLIKSLLDKQKHNSEVETIETLHKYTMFLEKEGYTDSDTYTEEPIGVDRFLESLK